MKSTLNFGLEKCIYKKYLNFDIFHHIITINTYSFHIVYVHTLPFTLQLCAGVTSLIFPSDILKEAVE